MYEEVDEQQYSKMVRDRQDDDWIIDDGESESPAASALAIRAVVSSNDKVSLCLSSFLFPQMELDTWRTEEKSLTMIWTMM